MTVDDHARPGIAPDLADLVVPIDSVRPFPGNARRHNLEKIIESLRANGQYRPIVVNRRGGEILAGNGTHAAAQQLGWAEIAVTWVDVDDNTARKIVLVDNKANDDAGYDDHLLADLLNQVDDLIGTGYTPEDLDDLATRLLDDPDEPDEPAKLSEDPVEMRETWQVIINCHDEDQQQAIYERLSAEGLRCRVLSL